MKTQSIVLALTGAIPALVAMWILDRLDAKRPEPLFTRWMISLAGMGSVIPAIFIELALMRTIGERVPPLGTYQGASFHAFAIAAAVEEACKIMVVYWVVWWRPEFDERMDGIVYAGRAGLGFALVENVMYLMNETAVRDQLVLWVERALLAVPGHAMWTGMIGAMAARRRFDHKGLGLLGGYLLAVAFHGAYDCTVFVSRPLHLEGHDTLRGILVAGPVVLTIAAFFVLRGMVKTALKLDDVDAAKRAAAAAVVVIQVQVEPAPPD
jgi:RsiW-degrading membrane proteinase PrsW (M82 family)